MDRLFQIESAGRRFLETIDAKMVEAVRRGGEWIACRPGCTQCCKGPFGITSFDALRLRRAMQLLESADPARAARILARAAAYTEPVDETDCPALDPDTGLCEVYEFRPVLCRVFGPVTFAGDGEVQACELCYEGASDAEIIQCAVEIDSEGRETHLVSALRDLGFEEETTVAAALLSASKMG